MRFIQLRKIRRTLALTLLVVFIQPYLDPIYTYALTTGPHQPEYISYESPGATDMVNLMTGDFSFSLPILDVPGPEGNFSVPLAYNGGIALEQQSSWVGLGWNLNVGAITRNINEFPDDAAGETHSVRVMDFTGVKGWNSSILGIVNLGWNSNTGHSGSVSLLGIVSVGWSGGEVSSVGIIGITVSGDGVDFDPVQFTTAVITVVTWGVGGAFASVAAFAKQAAVGVVTNAVVSTAMTTYSGHATPSAPTAGVWSYKKAETSRGVFSSHYHIYLDQTREERMYGSLHLGKATSVIDYSNADGNVDLFLKNGGVSETLKEFPRSVQGTVASGVASDINYQIDSGQEYYQVNNPAFLALDNYAVNGPGISGSIMPYRLDVGSVSMPREMTNKHNRLAPVQYANYKVPFIYKGSISNSYYHHAGGSSAVTSPSFYFGLDRELASTVPASNNSLTYLLNDVALKSQRVRTDVSSVLLPATTTNKLPQGNHIEWMSNAEIKASASYTNGFLDFVPNTLRQSFRTSPVTSLPGTPMTSFCYTSNYSANLPVDNFVMADADVNEQIIIKLTTANGQPINYEFAATVESKNTTNSTIVINSLYELTMQYAGQTMSYEITYYKDNLVWDTAIGGFVITASNGLSYHFALPVYDYNLKSVVINATDPNKQSEISRDKPFANTWLLTSITGPDFVDRNANGIADDSDWGYWVRFHYGKADDFDSWRIPYNGVKRDATNSTNNYSSGRKQRYHLNSIETRSHLALFIKSSKQDRGHKLNEIVLMQKEQYKKLIAAPYNLADATNNYLSMYSDFNITTGIRDYINKNAMRRIVFQYDYSLCPGIPSSSVQGAGKLTLKRVSLYGKNNLKTVPDYVFDYGDNFSYNENYWDGWGAYTPQGTAEGNTHQASSNDSHGRAWSLTKITTPIGNKIEINYERDRYASISGQAITEKSGGNIRVSAITMKDDFNNIHKIRYLYMKEDGTCSGVVAKEPEYIKTTDYPFYNLPYYPFTPVLYSRVSVLNGTLSTDADYHTKTVYEFETPHTNQIVYVKNPVKANEVVKTIGAVSSDYLSMTEHKIQDYSSKIGNLNSIKVFNKAGTLYSSSQMTYTNTLNTQNYQGTFTQGTLMFDRVENGFSKYHKINKMTTVVYPNTIKKVVNSKDGFSAESENLIWDLVSGRVIETLEKSSLGFNVKTVMKPAYSISTYSELGPKAVNISNKNMLGATAASYTYKTNSTGTPLGLLGASVQLWRKDWSNYRYYNGTAYADDPQSQVNPVWRKGATYAWKGSYSRRLGDGTQTFAPADEFNFVSPSLTNWQYLGELLRFDHYGMPLEAKDYNQTAPVYSATKMGYDSRNIIAKASNAQFHEITFSSAEDKIASIPFFGGEVGLGSGTVVTTPVHTGKRSLSVPAGTYGFVYKTNGLTVNKTYRASVWSNSTNGRVYYKLNGGAEVLSSAPTTATKAGNWYRIDLNIPMGSATAVEVGVKSASGTVVFDDFRFQPAESVMTCYVINPLDFEFTTTDFTTSAFVLDNDNLYTRYLQSGDGLLSQVYQESFKYGATVGERQLSETKTNFRRFQINQ